MIITFKRVNLKFNRNVANGQNTRKKLAKQYQQQQAYVLGKRSEYQFYT